MELAGKIWKKGKFWLIEIPILDVMTQGYTRKEAIKMLKDAIEGLVSCYFPKESKGFAIVVNDYGKESIAVSSSDNSLMLAFNLRRQREISKLTIREVSQRLGSNSPNSYARYEKGKKRISMDHYERLLQAVNPKQNYHLRIV